MKRHLQLRYTFNVQRYSTDAWSIGLPIATLEVAPLCCELSLLLLEKVEAISLLFTNGSKLVISITTENSRVTNFETKTISIALCRRDLEMVLCFLLIWYRDSVAEVNHLDIDLVSTTSFGPDCTLIVEAEESRLPLTADEAMKILKEMP